MLKSSLEKKGRMKGNWKKMRKVEIIINKINEKMLKKQIKL